MARPREPIALIKAKGKKHLTKAEIKAREAAEVKPLKGDIVAPGFLTPAQKTKFNRLANQLSRQNLMGETDTECLARYVAAQSIYEQTTKELRSMLQRPPKDNGAEKYYERVEAWVKSTERLALQQDRYFKQASAAARDLGLTISSRCKLVAPQPPEPPKGNKFDRFEMEADDE